MSEREAQTTVLHAQQLVKRFGGITATDHVTLELKKGARHALIGPNGSGKTTLLRCLLGLQKLDSGVVKLLGEPIGPRVLGRIGYVPQRLQLESSFTISVREFLSLRRRETRRWFWQSHRKTDALLLGTLGKLGVESLLDRPLAGLSGGQLQRVLIAYSLLSEPELLLLDEPTAGVDTPGEQSFYELISGIHARLKITVVLVSHDLAMVFRQASWVYALNGVICCEGHPEQVLNADSLKAAYGIHVTPYHHHHGHGSAEAGQPIQFRRR
jgi:ABC-type Mn2+/Zn2+ transport system ATPase subunit